MSIAVCTVTNLVTGWLYAVNLNLTARKKVRIALGIHKAERVKNKLNY